MSRPDAMRAALAVLATLQTLMLFALMARLQPHPPQVIALFAMGPFLSASVAVAVAAAVIAGARGGLPIALAGLAAVLALVSYGPQKWFDPGIAGIWPAVLVGQVAAVSVLGLCIARLRQARLTSA